MNVARSVRSVALSLTLGLVAACGEAEAPEAAVAPEPVPEETVVEEPTVEEPANVIVPDVVGVRLRQGRRILTEAGLDVEKTRKSSPEPEGTVLRQRPLGGLEVQIGRTVTLVVAKPKPPPPPQDCQGYSPCLPPGPDVDCAGGTGDGPRYVEGPVSVTGSDPYRLDDDNDGVGCES